MTHQNVSRLLALLVTLTISGLTLGGDCCSCCQCQCQCTKVCRLVNEEKKVDVVCWGCLCEEFCVPCPSQPGCEHCETVCDPCLEKAAQEKAAADKPKEDDKPTKPKKIPSSKPKKFVWTTWIPGKADIYTKKKLMKKVVTKKIPSYKWVVEDLCPECQANAKSAPIESDAKIPTPPKTDAKIIEPEKIQPREGAAPAKPNTAMNHGQSPGGR